MLRKEKELARKQRKKRVRDRVRGTQERPRLSVFKSSRHIYVQVIDDTRGHTLATASTLGLAFPQEEKGQGKVGLAKRVGWQIAEKALALKVAKVVFDRNGFLYHGRVKALADGAREKGLDF